MQAYWFEFPPLQSALSSHAAYHPHLDSSFHFLFEEAHDLRIAKFGIVNQQFLFCALQKSRELLPCIQRADHEIGVRGLVRLAFEIGLEEFARFLNQLGVASNQSEA